MPNLTLTFTRQEDASIHLRAESAAAGAAWAIARRDIYEQWAEATDPAKLQPRVRPVFRQAAEQLRKHPPADTNQDEINRVLESVEAPWGARIEREFRNILAQEGKAAHEISAEIVAKVRELGLQPFIPPEPLPVIEEDEVQLVCWLAVDSQPSG